MIDTVRASLEAKQRSIVALIDALTEALDSAGESANRSRSDRYERSADRHSQASALQELRRQSTAVERALAKLEDGSYGVCESCGEQIPPARLQIHPWALQCITCATPG